MTLLSKPQFYITHNYWTYAIRILKWEAKFHPEEETTTASLQSHGSFFLNFR